MVAEKNVSNPVISRIAVFEVVLQCTLFTPIVGFQKISVVDYGHATRGLKLVDAKNKIASIWEKAMT